MCHVIFHTEADDFKLSFIYYYEDINENIAKLPKWVKALLIK